MVLSIAGTVVDGNGEGRAPRGRSGRAETTARMLAPLVRDHQVVVAHVAGGDGSFGASLAGALRDAVPGLVVRSLERVTLVNASALVDTGITIVVPAANELAVVALAHAIEADALMLLAEVDAVYRDFGTPRATPLRRLTTTDAKAFLDGGTVTPASMAPQLEAAIRFATTGGFAVIAALGDVEAALHRTAGTRVVLADGTGRVPPDPRPRRSCGISV